MDTESIPASGVCELALEVYVTDPDGHVLELWTWDVAGHLAEHAAGESPGSH